MNPLIGREIDGRYRLLNEVGEGAMGTVYRAERLDSGGFVAVKVLNEDCSDQTDLRERFEREARALFGLSHPHILDVQDYGVMQGQRQQPYLVMEMLEGKSLDEMVDEEDLEPQTGLALARQILEGLSFAHAAGVLHRDLKTENVFVVRGPGGALHAKLLDFGLVKFVDDERWGEGRKLTVAGSVMGSPAYMSPEQGTGGPTDARSDVYSAGVVLFELVSGAWPYVAESRVEMLKAHLIEPIPKLASVRAGLRTREQLDRVLERALAKEPNDRFNDATEMLAALAAVPEPAVWLDTIPAPAMSAPSQDAPPSQPAGSLPPPPPASGVVLSGGLVAQQPTVQPVGQPVSVSQARPPQPRFRHPAAHNLPAANRPAPPAQPHEGRSRGFLFLLGGLVAFCVLATIVSVVAALLSYR